MPYIAGESLRHRLNQAGTLPLVEALRIAGQVGDALAYAHARAIIHRDVKPAVAVHFQTLGVDSVGSRSSLTSTARVISHPKARGRLGTMRFMIIVKATKDSEAGVTPPETLFATMAQYHEELQKAGVLLDASGLQPSSKGWRIKYSGGKRTVIDGPFTEAKELVAGYTLIQVKSKEEAMEWARRFPNPALEDGEIEVRQLYELDDFAQSESIERFRKIGVGTQREAR